MDDEPQPTFSYDRVAYPSPVLEGLTPDRLRASALLHGYNPPDARTASLLEIGCGDGIGLVAWAAVAPEARIAGFDLSPGAVAKGRALAEAAGFANVDLHAGDILTYPRDGAKFDYIVCHGVLSWVPGFVRSPLIELIAAKLAPGGIAYVSYDCLPGAAQKAAIVSFLRSRVSQTDDPMDAMRQAAVVVDMINRTIEPGSKLRDQVDILIKTMENTSAGYFYHDWLSEAYQPVDLRQLIAESASHGLRLAGSASNYDLDPPGLDPEAATLLRSFGDDHGQRLLALELLRGPNIFHRDLFIRADAPPPQIAKGHTMLSYGFGGSREDIVGEKGTAVRYVLNESFTVTTQHPETQAVMDLLLTGAPREFTFSEILAATGVDEAGLLTILLTVCKNNFIASRTTPMPFVTESGERPRAGRLVSAMAEEGTRIIDLRSRDMEITEDETRLLLLLSDGTRTHAQIATDLSGIVGREVPVATVAGAVAHFARRRLFVA